MKLWAGRFGKKLAAEMETFNRSLGFDIRLLQDDLSGSIAYAKALRRAKLLTASETKKIVSALGSLKNRQKNLSLLPEDEDVHSVVERLLIKKIGSIGKKLHTGRSRNSQVTLDTRMYLKREIGIIQKMILDFMSVILKQAKGNTRVIMPAFTHLQMAQPVLLAHYFLSFFFMLQRDVIRLDNAYQTADIMPLGSGALAGSGFPLDRNFLARTLGFKKVSDNSIDAVSDRDFILEFLSALSILAMHLSRFAEDLILFASAGYQFFELSEAYSTGSSMMPNKKNPDALELIRGKTGRIYGNLFSVFTILKGLPLTYNKDLQEDKEPLFDSIDQIKGALQVFAGALATVKINRDKIEAALDPDLLATDLADEISLTGVPFREAHAIVGKVVRDCSEKGIKLNTLTPAALKKYSAKIPARFRFDFSASIARRKIYGGTGLTSVLAQIRRGQHFLKSHR